MAKKAATPKKKPGWAAMKKWFDNSVAITAAGVGVLLKEAGGTTTYRERVSEIGKRYVGVGLDGSVDLGKPVNTWLGVGHRWVDQRIKTRIGYFRAVGARKALPMLAEGIPFLFAMDAGRGITDATAKIAAWHRCYNQTLDGYDPQEGVYDGFAEPKNMAYTLFSYIGFGASKSVSSIAPELNEGISKFTGGILKGF